MEQGGRGQTQRPLLPPTGGTWEDPPSGTGWRGTVEQGGRRLGSSHPAWGSVPSGYKTRISLPESENVVTTTPAEASSTSFSSCLQLASGFTWTTEQDRPHATVFSPHRDHQPAQGESPQGDGLGPSTDLTPGSPDSGLSRARAAQASRGKTADTEQCWVNPSVMNWTPASRMLLPVDNPGSEHWELSVHCPSRRRKQPQLQEQDSCECAPAVISGLFLTVECRFIHAIICNVVCNIQDRLKKEDSFSFLNTFLPVHFVYDLMIWKQSRWLKKKDSSHYFLQEFQGCYGYSHMEDTTEFWTHLESLSFGRCAQFKSCDFLMKAECFSHKTEEISSTDAKGHKRKLTQH